MAEFNSNTIYNENEWAKLIKAEILNILDEQVFSAGLDPVAEQLNYTMEVLEIPNGEYTSMLGVHSLGELGEFDDYPIINKEQGFTKGYKVQRRGWKIAISKPLRKWIETSTSSAKLSPTVKSELNNLARDTQRLINAVKLTKNEVATEVFTEGFSITSANGAGSMSPDGVALFSDSHIIKGTGETQSNLVNGALTQTTLEAAIEKLRNMKDGTGRKMRRANTYALYVAPENEANARRILNNGSNFAASVSDTETNNSITSNIFMWDGFRIELVVLDTLNQPKPDGSKVGTATMWFLMNKDAAREMGAFKYLTLYNEEMDMYIDNNTKVLYLDVDLSFTCDHYQPEVVVGSLGV